jgi:hypothetical protein
MPIKKPNKAAAAVPASNASVKQSQPGTASPTHTETNAPTKPPTLIKPACPRLSSPRMPTVRLREIAIMIYAQIGTSCPDREFVSMPMPESSWMAKNITTTIP